MLLLIGFDFKEGFNGQLHEIAKAGGGKYYEAHSQKDMNKFFRCLNRISSACLLAVRQQENGFTAKFVQTGKGSLRSSEGNNKNSGKVQSCESIRGVYGFQRFDRQSFLNSYYCLPNRKPSF
jgi:hypothetical protein